MALSICAATARGEAPRSALTLEVERCDSSPIDQAALAEQLRVALAEEAIEVEVEASTPEPNSLDVSPPEPLPRSAPPTEPGLALLRVRRAPCTPDATTVDLRIDDRTTDKRVTRRVDLAEVEPALRLRALAIAAAELLIASWAELALRSAEAQDESAGAPLSAVRLRMDRARTLAAPSAAAGPGDPAGPSDRAGPGDAARSSTSLTEQARAHPTVSLDAAFTARSFPGARAGLAGGYVGLDVSMADPLVLLVGVDVTVGESLDRLGRIDLGLFAGRAAVGLHTAAGAFDFAVGPLIELGYAWTDGQPYDASTVTESDGDLVMLTGAVVRGRASLDASVALVLDVQGALTLRALEALSDGRPVTGISGPSIAVRLGLAIAPW